MKFLATVYFLRKTPSNFLPDYLQREQFISGTFGSSRYWTGGGLYILVIPSRTHLSTDRWPVLVISNPCHDKNFPALLQNFVGSNKALGTRVTGMEVSCCVSYS